VALLQLVEQGKLQLNQSLTSIFGYQIANPYFPDEDITLEMVLSHQSSLLDCEPFYSNFLSASINAKSGYDIPDIK
jgi:D-alanyl-D-alanine carboxypeptidase